MAIHLNSTKENVKDGLKERPTRNIHQIIYLIAFAFAIAHHMKENVNHHLINSSIQTKLLKNKLNLLT